MNEDTKGSIGIFDSGIGGVTVLKEIIKLLPIQRNYRMVRSGNFYFHA